MLWKELLLGCLVNFETSFGVGWLTSPFQKETLETFSHIEPWFVSVNLPKKDRQLCKMDTIWTLCWLPSSQSKLANYYGPTSWKVEFLVFSHKNLAFKYLLAHLQRLATCNSLGWLNWTMPHAFGEILWTWSFALRAISPRTFKAQNFAQAYCNRQIGLLHLDGTITNRKEIGLGRLLPSWFQDDIFTLQVQLNRRELWRSLTRAF